MVDHRCKNCQFWDNVHVSVADIPMELGKNNRGFCRKHKPGAFCIGQYYYGVWPVTDADEFCGEFRAA